MMTDLFPVRIRKKEVVKDIDFHESVKMIYSQRSMQFLALNNIIEGLGGCGGFKPPPPPPHTHTLDQVMSQFTCVYTHVYV